MNKFKKFEKRTAHKLNSAIKAEELRVIGPDGEMLGIMKTADALQRAQDLELDLIEVTAQANPPVAKISEYGKFLYELEKKKKKASGGKTTETKSIQVKVGTGEHDLELKAKTASKWLAEGHRIKIELYLSGRSKFLDEKFLRERLNRILNLITEEYKIAEEIKRVPKGLMLTIERSSGKH